ncbi:MAG: hypothetical protein HY874_03810 [Chloroflexi bacterium]|nr:hypothetical protein [Chloroflexota bacterium]
MPLDNRNLETGTVLHARYKGTARTCEVVQTADGLRYRLDDGWEFASPSSAGKAAMDGVSCNGWRFWSIAGTGKTKRKPKADKPAKAKKAHAAKKSAKAKAAKPKKSKAVRAAATSDRSVAAETASYGCGVCGETLPTMKAATRHATEAHVS